MPLEGTGKFNVASRLVHIVGSETIEGAYHKKQVLLKRKGRSNSKTLSHKNIL